MLETLAEGCAKKMMKQAEAAKKCTDPVPPKVKIMLTVALATAESNTTARVTFTNVARTTAEVTPDASKPQFKFIVDLTQLSCPSCSCEEPLLTDWPCNHIFLAAYKSGVLDFSALLCSHDKTPEWQEMYSFFDDHPTPYPSTAVVYSNEETDLHLAAYVPKPSGRPSKARMKSRLEMQRRAGNGGFGASQQSAQGGSQAGPSSAATPLSAQPPQRTGTAQRCRKCGQLRRGHTCTG
jgi:hypothetical protein